MKKLIHEIHRRSLWQVLSIYLIGGWVALQAVDILQATLRLPEWTPSLALVLLVVGLPIVLATAFVQEGIGPRAAAQDLPAAEPAGAESGQDAAEPAPAPAVHHRVFTWRNLAFGAAGAFLILFGFAGLYVVLQDRGRSFAPTEATAVEPDPGIAFLPFEVSGPELENLREGMVTLLFTTLDGVAGLRAIDSRTVLAKWDQQVGPGVRADLETLLSVARATDARYAFVGSAVGLGARLRLSGDIHDLDRGTSLDRVQVEGNPDSLQSIVNDLAIETLRALAQPGVEFAPRADLAGVTTHSLPALTAYLEGESYFRRGDFQAAYYAFTRALSADSTFALAHYRIANVLSWNELPGAVLIEDDEDHLTAALAGNLPPRKQLYARAQSAGGDSDSYFAIAEDLRAAVRRQPDDAEAWFLLGDHLTHAYWGGVPEVAPEEANQALRRATELDPSFAVYVIHLIGSAFADEDANEAAHWVEAFGRASPGSRADRTNRSLYRLAFGPILGSGAFDAAVDTLADLTDPQNRFELMNPQASRVAESVHLRHAERAGFMHHDVCWRYALTEGRWGQFLRYATDGRMTPGGRLMCLYQADMRDFPVPRDLLQETMVLALESGSRWAPLWAGLFAASESRWNDYEEMRALLQDRLASARASGESYARYVAWLSFLEGYSLWQLGELERAAEVLEDLPPIFRWPPVLWWLGRINLELGHPEVAAHYFTAVRQWAGGLPWTRALYYLGQAYEQMGDLEKARQAYADYLDGWKDADPELQPLVEQGRDALVRLGPLDQ